jgi:tripartite-type tricarboxylate transporter receptor subunit TctC
MGVFAPGGTPAPLVQTISDAIAAVLKEPATATRLQGMGVDPVGNSPSEFAAYLEQDRSKFARLFKQAGLTPQ